MLATKTRGLTRSGWQEDSLILQGADQSEEKKRFFEALEGLRGIAAVLVMLRHIPKYIAPIRFEINYLAVDLFFNLSGFVIAYSYEKVLISGTLSFKKFVVLRLLRVMPLYWLGTLIGLVAALIGSRDSLAQTALFAVLAFFMIPFIGPDKLFPLNSATWSLFFEFIANFFYGRFIRRLTSKVLVVIVTASFISLCVGAFTTGSALNIGRKKEALIYGIPRVMFSFFVGVLLQRAVIEKGWFSVSLGAKSAFIVLLASITALSLPIRPPQQPYYGLIMISLFFPALILTSSRVLVSGATHQAFRMLGAMSFPLYALHKPLYALSRALLGKALDRYAPWSALFFTLVTVPLSLIIHYGVDVPLRRRLKTFIARDLL